MKKHEGKVIIIKAFTKESLDKAVNRTKSEIKGRYVSEKYFAKSILNARVDKLAGKTILFHENMGFVNVLQRYLLQQRRKLCVTFIFPYFKDKEEHRIDRAIEFSATHTIEELSEIPEGMDAFTRLDYVFGARIFRIKNEITEVVGYFTVS